MPMFLQKPTCAIALMVLAVVVMLHGNLGGKFYSVDDNRYVPHSIKGTIRDLFTPKNGILYGPVTFLTLRMDRALFGPSVEEVLNSKEFNDLKIDPAPKASWSWGPRLMNGFYHGLAGLLLWYFFLRLGVGANTALFIAFVWTAHPAALESVAWVCERKNVLCALFGFATLVAWTSDRTWRWRWPLIWFLYTLALLSKLAGLSFLPVLIALELFDLQRVENPTASRFWVRLMVRLSAILIVSGCLIKVSMGLFSDDIAAPPGGSMWTGLLTDSEIFGRYMLNSLVPLFSSFFYGVEPIVSLADQRFWLYGLMMAAFWSAMYVGAIVEDRRWIAVGFLWFFGALGPNSNIIATAFPMQDRYAYLPMPGLLLAFAIGMRGVFARFPNGERALQIAAPIYAGIVLILCGCRSPLFRNSDLLTFDAIQRQPMSAFAMKSGAYIADREYKAHLPSGSFPNPDVARAAAEQALLFYAATEKTYESWQFTGPISSRTESAELLLYLSRDREAIEMVEPILKTAAELTPPLDPMKLFPQLPESYRPRFNLKHCRFMMVRSWLAAAEGWLRVSFHLNTPKQERLSLARKSADYVKRAIEFETKDNPTALLKLGRAQLRISYLLAEENAMDDARKAYTEARATLQREAIQQQGAELLKNVPEPEAPKPSNPK